MFYRMMMVDRNPYSFVHRNFIFFLHTLEEIANAAIYEHGLLVPTAPDILAKTFGGSDGEPRMTDG